MKLTISFILLSLLATAQGFNDKRILVVVALENSSEVENQIKILKKNSMELEKRRIAVFTLINDKLKPRINSSEKSEKFVEKNKTNYTATSSLKIYLIGLDRSVKQTFSNFVEPQRIFEIVDSMPMRQTEMRKN